MSLQINYTAETAKVDMLITALLVGFKGEGKTSTALSFPSPFVCDWDGGLSTIAGDRRVPNLFMPSYEELLELIMAVQLAKRSENIVLKSRTLDGKIEEVEVPCRTVIFDSITKGHRKFLESAMAVGRRSSPILQDWGLAAQRVIDCIDMLKPFVNVIVVGHYEIIKDANLERVIAQLRIPGQLADLIPISCDEMWRVKTDIVADAQRPGGRRRQVQIWTCGDGIYPAATRLAQRGLPPVVDVSDKAAYDVMMSFIK